MRYGVILIILGSVLFTSCQKELSFDSPVSGGGSGGGGGTTATDYQPVSAGSEWNYVSVGATGDYKVVSLGTDSTISGKKYYKFDNIQAAGTARSYINKENGIYTTYATATSAGGATVPNLTLIYLKDAAVGTNWVNDISYMGTTSHHKYTVSAKGISKTVGPNTFNNVIELTYLLSVGNPLGGADLQIGDGKYYFAKGVGFIESDLSSGFAGVVITDTTRLASYTIH
jgi:hypothetical protein